MSEVRTMDPRRWAARIGIALVQGLLLWWLYDVAANDRWPEDQRGWLAGLITVAVIVPGVHYLLADLATAARQRLVLLALALLSLGLGWHHGAWTADAPYREPLSFILPLGVLLFLLLPFVQSALTRGSPAPAVRGPVSLRLAERAARRARRRLHRGVLAAARALGRAVPDDRHRFLPRTLRVGAVRDTGNRCRSRPRLAVGRLGRAAAGSAPAAAAGDAEMARAARDPDPGAVHGRPARQVAGAVRRAAPGDQRCMAPLARGIDRRVAERRLPGRQ